MSAQSDVITIKRTQPVQGQEVRAELFWNTEPAGSLRLPFAAWIKFSRLLQKGVEMDGRENHQLNVKLRIEGLVPLDQVPVTRLAPQREVFPAPTNLELPSVPIVPLAKEVTRSLFVDDENDPDIAAAEYAAAVEQQLAEQPEASEHSIAVTEKLVRSLKPEGSEGNE